MAADRLTVERYADRLWAHLNAPAPIVWLVGAYIDGGENWRRELLRARGILTDRINAAQTLLDELDKLWPETEEDD